MTQDPRKTLPLSALDPELAKFDHAFFAGHHTGGNASAAMNKLPSHKPPARVPRRAMPYELRKMYRSK